MYRTSFREGADNLHEGDYFELSEGCFLENNTFVKSDPSSKQIKGHWLNVCGIKIPKK